MKFGARLRENETTAKSTSNFNGTYSFGTPFDAASAACFNGSLNDPRLPALSNPNALQDYQYTQILLDEGVPIQTILQEGCGPNSYSLNSGASTFSKKQFDAGIFAQDDWRLRPNITLSGGLRFESQSGVADKFDLAPRLAVSWAPGGKSGQASKTVLRGGMGIFYDRFPLANALNALRFNGFGQQDFTINSTTLLDAAFPVLSYYGAAGGPATPPLSLLGAAVAQPIYEIDSNLKSSYMIQTAGSIERALPGRTTLTVNITNSRGVHDMRQRQINAFLPGSYLPGSTTLTGVAPLSQYGKGFVYLYEDSGMYKQLQVITSVNTRVNSHVSLNGYWAWSDYHTNTNGLPGNQYNTALDWGRAAVPANRFNLLGTVGLPFGWTASPSFSASTSSPLNILIGNDYNGDGSSNDRPAFAPAGAACSATIKCTPYGNFNVAPGLNYTPIPINYANGNSRWDADLRLSRTWGWGEGRNVAGATGGSGGGGGRGDGGRGGDRRGGGGGFAGGGRGFGTVGGGSSHRYNIGLTIAATDIFNHVNLSNPVGVLNSPFFGQSKNAVSFGQGLGGGGVTGTRRIQLTLRFTY